MANLTIPHKFAGLEPAIANEVNENFEAMKAYTIALQNELNTINETITELGKKPVREVFAIYPSISSKTPTGAYPLWTGETITNARTLFPAFWQECLERKTLGTIKTVASDTDYDAVVEEYGQCSSFFIDELNGHIRLPMITRFVSSLSTVGDYGAIDNAGLPEITAFFDSRNLGEVGGSFSLGEATSGSSGTGDRPTTMYRADFSASASSEIYGGSDTVQPEAMKLCWFIQVATNVADISDMDLETIARELSDASEQLQSEYDELILSLNGVFSQRIEAFDINASSKLQEYNENDSSKTSAFNTNYEEKNALLEAEVVKAENAATEAQRIADDLGNITVVKGRVDTVYDLPAEGNKNGDVYFVGLETSSQKEEYIWDGVRWELFGVSSGSLSDYYTKEQTDALLEENFEKTVFSINEASKDTSGNPNFMSVLGEQITFNGAVKYTQANGESVEKASVSSINIPLKYEPEGVVNPIVQANISEAATVTNTGTIYAGNDRAYKCFDGTRTLDNDLVAWSTSSGSVKEEFAKPVYGRNFKVSILTHYYTDPSRTLGNVVITIYYDDNTTQDISMGTLSGNQVHETELFNTEKGIKAIELTHSGSVINVTTLDIVYFDLVGEQLKTEDGYVILNNGVASVVPALEVQQSEPVSPVAQTVWFNPYNNQAKQYNGADWVDYNGVPVGPINDGIAYNYQYNTWKGVSPVFDSASPETNGVVVRLCMPDYTRSEDFVKDQEYKIEKDGVIEITARCTHATQESLIINGTSFEYASSYTNSNSTGSLYKVVYKGDTVLAQGSGSIKNYKFTPFKGAL